MTGLRLTAALLTCLLLTATPDTTCSQEDFIDSQDKQFLLRLARQTLERYLAGGSVPEVAPETVSEALRQKAPCFVTLHKKVTGLRGCIGLFERKSPLFENVISRAIAAAVYDPRFQRVAPEELKEIKIEISVLTKPEPLAFESPEDLLSKLRPMMDGVILETPYGSATFLPQVWEQLPDKETFLAHLCMKHGAPANAWKKDYRRVKVKTYQAIVFEEKHYGGDGTRS